MSYMAMFRQRSSGLIPTLCFGANRSLSQHMEFRGLAAEFAGLVVIFS
jgi:hypothetical protein